MSRGCPILLLLLSASLHTQIHERGSTMAMVVTRVVRSSRLRSLSLVTHGTPHCPARGARPVHHAADIHAPGPSTYLPWTRTTDQAFDVSFTSRATASRPQVFHRNTYRHEICGGPRRAAASNSFESQRNWCRALPSQFQKVM